MPRVYTVNFEGVAVSAPQDLFQIGKAGDSRAAKSLKLLRVKLSTTDTTIPTSQMLQVRARIATATVTDGSGGTTSFTPAKTDLGDAAASFVACTNNTTKATTTGAFTILLEDGFHAYNGYDENLDVDGRARSNPVAFNGEVIVVELISTVSGTVHMSGTAWVEETGG